MTRRHVSVAALLLVGCGHPPEAFEPARVSVEPAASAIPAAEPRPQLQQPGQPPAVPTRTANRTGVNVKDYGASGDGTTDDTNALQAAIDDAIYVKNVQEVHLPDGVYRITRTLHLGYGDELFRTVRLVGAGMRFGGASAFHGTLIVADFNAGPAINMQGGRNSRIELLTIQGVNRNHLFDGKPHVIGLDTPVDGSDIDVWRGPALRANPLASSRYAPYAGVAIDAYTGSKPEAGAYPDVKYPAGRNQKPWDRLQSGNPTLMDVEIIGFEVGVVTHPSGSDGNGDFLNLWRCRIWYCPYALSIGHSQSRSVYANYCTFQMIHTVLTTRTHGKQVGEVDGLFSACSFNGVIRVFDIQQADAGPVKLDTCYGELMWRLGDFGTPSAAANVPTVIDNCRLHFFEMPGLGRPATLAAGGSGVVLRGGVFILPDITTIDSDLVLDGLTVRNHVVEDKKAFTLAERKAVNASMHMLPRMNRLGDRPQKLRVTSYFPDVSKDTKAHGERTGLFSPTNGRNSTMPYCWSGVGYVEGKGGVWDNLAGGSLTPAVYPKAKSRTELGTNGAGTIELADQGTPAQSGDLIQDDGTLTLWRVESVREKTAPSASVCTVTPLNNLKGRAGGLRTPINDSAGYYYLLRSGVYLPQQQLYGDLRAGRATIEQIARGDGQPPTLNVAAGDFVMDALRSGARSPFVERAVVRGVNPQGRTITLTSNAVTRNRTEYPLSFFLRGEGK